MIYVLAIRYEFLYIGRATCDIGDTTIYTGHGKSTKVGIALVGHLSTTSHSK